MRSLTFITTNERGCPTSDGMSFNSAFRSDETVRAIARWASNLLSMSSTARPLPRSDLRIC
jgi:hypothetical protein